MAVATRVVVDLEIPEADGAAQAQGTRQVLATQASEYGAEVEARPRHRFHQALAELVAGCLSAFP